jgi:hypothetical protein
MKRSDIDQHDVDLVGDLVDLLVLDEPVIRMDRVVAARARLAVGHHPTPFDLAGTVVDHFA